ncbi:MAG: 50S ribosomal protein L33 [candidate division WOR-3 bacterium]
MEKLTKLKCAKCKRINYWPYKNKKTVTKKLSFSKFCPWCRRHTQHQENK